MTVLLWTAAFVLWRLTPMIGEMTQFVGITGGLMAFTTVGTVIAVRRPANRIAWLFIAIGGAAAFMSLAINYAHYGLLIRPEPLPLAHLAAWAQNWLWTALFASIGLVFLLFPDGHLPSRRWRPVAWGLPLLLLVYVVTSALRPRLAIGNDEWGLEVANPIGLPGAQPVVTVLEEAGFLVALVLLLSAVSAALVRYRRARGAERMQLKWFAYGAAVTLALFAVPLPESVAFLEAAVFWVVPLAVGTALLRHRLYDIDRIVSRTVSYVSVSLVLIGVYAGGVLLLGTVLPLSSELAVAGSTLAIAALFRPLVRRLRSIIDRRFDRSRYDAQRTVESFSQRLRDEVDLQVLRGELIGVVGETMHPRAVGLWTAPVRGASAP